MSPPPEPEQAADTGGNMFTRKYGPLPGWAWLLITAAAFYAFSKYRSSKQAQTTQTTTGTQQPNVLTSNLVGVQEPVPTLAGTYQVSVQPAQNIYTQPGSGSTQGVATPNVPSGQLSGTNTTTTNANGTAAVAQPQTQGSPSG